jgi:hypothetical protein
MSLFNSGGGGIILDFHYMFSYESAREQGAVKNIWT